MGDWLDQLEEERYERLERNCRNFPYSHPDWQKWIPIYGLGYEGKSDREGYPPTVDFWYRRWSYHVNNLYQVAFLVGGIVGAVKGLELIIEKLF
jgi:hypothetical protein